MKRTIIWMHAHIALIATIAMIVPIAPIVPLVMIALIVMLVAIETSPTESENTNTQIEHHNQHVNMPSPLNVEHMAIPA